MDQERFQFTRTTLWAFANLISATCVVDDEGCENVRVALEGCDWDKDRSEFVGTKGTGTEIPRKPNIK